MTPTLLGRWQIRLFLLSTIGLVISLLVWWITRSPTPLPLLALLYVFIVGCILDVLYQYIQSFRWDRDWPTSFQVVAGIVEGLLVWLLVELSNHFALAKSFTLIFLIQYGSIWLIIFALLQGPLRILWPQWRYQGGEWLRKRNRGGLGLSGLAQPSQPSPLSQPSPGIPSPPLSAPRQAPRPIRQSFPPNLAAPIPPPQPPGQPGQQKY